MTSPCVQITTQPDESDASDASVEAIVLTMSTAGFPALGVKATSSSTGRPVFVAISSMFCSHRV